MSMTTNSLNYRLEDINSPVNVHDPNIVKSKRHKNHKFLSRDAQNNSDGIKYIYYKQNINDQGEDAQNNEDTDIEDFQIMYEETADDLSDITSLPSITFTNDEYFKWIKKQNASTSSSSRNSSKSTNASKLSGDEYQLQRPISRSDTMTTTHTVSSLHDNFNSNSFFDENYFIRNNIEDTSSGSLKNKSDSSAFTDTNNNNNDRRGLSTLNYSSLINENFSSNNNALNDLNTRRESVSLSKDNFTSISPPEGDLILKYSKANKDDVEIIEDDDDNDDQDLSEQDTSRQQNTLTSRSSSCSSSDYSNQIRSSIIDTYRYNTEMVDTNNLTNKSSPPSNGNHQSNQQQQQDPNNPPRKDHYSYSYTYKTADPDTGIPGLSSVEVNESVTEEIGPDGSKIIRRHQQEKQINKITQVVTQRVIKRQYIDPNTGQIIEYDPNNELFANLPPETVFEEHTVISDDSGLNAPVVHTTTMSKTNGNNLTDATSKIRNGTGLIDQFDHMNLTDTNNYASLILKQHADDQIAQTAAGTASFRIKSHPEDNQGYPEERNMDYDPDDCYPDDDSPYEGLIQPPPPPTGQNNRNHYGTDEMDLYGLGGRATSGRRSDRQLLLNNGGGSGAGSTSGGSSSSPIMFDSNNHIDMPQVSNNYQKISSHYSTHQHHNHHYNKYSSTGTYATVLPSSNINCATSSVGGGAGSNNLTPRSNKYNAYEMTADPYQAIQQQTTIQTNTNYQIIKPQQQQVIQQLQAQQSVQQQGSGDYAPKISHQYQKNQNCCYNKPLFSVSTEVLDNNTNTTTTANNKYIGNAKPPTIPPPPPPRLTKFETKLNQSLSTSSTNSSKSSSTGSCVSNGQRDHLLIPSPPSSANSSASANRANNVNNYENVSTMTTWSAKNKSSLFIVDNDASIIIHHHHFDIKNRSKSVNKYGVVLPIYREMPRSVSPPPAPSAPHVRFNENVYNRSYSTNRSTNDCNLITPPTEEVIRRRRVRSFHNVSQMSNYTEFRPTQHKCIRPTDYYHRKFDRQDTTDNNYKRRSCFVNFQDDSYQPRYYKQNNMSGESSSISNMSSVSNLNLNNAQNNCNNNNVNQRYSVFNTNTPSLADSGCYLGTNVYKYPTSYLEGNAGIVVGGWRNPTLPEVIEYLTHSSNEIKANAAAYLQHLCYQDDDIKAKTRQLGGILRLVNLLNSDIPDVHKNACGALRNLSYGKTNDENKIDIRDKGGIPALIRLLKRTQDETVKETITAVLWNLSSCEEIKEPILYEGLQALVKYIIVPYSSIDVLNNGNQTNSNYNRASLLSLNNQNLKTQSRMLSSDFSNYPTVLTNATGVLRNCSSNLQFSNCYEARKKLRECDGLIESLLRIIDQAVEPYLNKSQSELRHQQQQQQSQSQLVNLDLVIKDNMNSKCVENCMCILRNLSFRLQEIVDPNYDREVKPMPTDEKSMKNSTKCVGGKKKKNLEEEFLSSVYPYNMPVPNEGKPQELLWSLHTLNKYIIIIKESTVRDTIEAAVGCLQNLTACYWRPSVVIRQEIRKLKGLPSLVHLLKSEEYEDEPIVSVTAIALRNLAIDAKNRDLIGIHAMKDLVGKLPDPQRPLPVRLSVLNEDTITAALACINECVKSNDEFVKSCYNEGGVKRMIFITRNGNYFPLKIVKYAAHVLCTMWKHKNLHDLLKKDGYKENDFTSLAKQMGLKSQSSSPANTLHRPRGDVNVKPSHHAPVQKKQKGSKSNTPSIKAKNGINQQQQQSYPKQSMQLNEVPIYSQVQKPNLSNGSSASSTSSAALNGNNQNNQQNRNLIITNGTTNADSWV